MIDEGEDLKVDPLLAFRYSLSHFQPLAYPSKHKKYRTVRTQLKLLIVMIMQGGQAWNSPYGTPTFHVPQTCRSFHLMRSVSLDNDAPH